MELCMREQTTNLICWMCQVYPRGLKKEIKYCSDSRTNVHVLNYPLIRLYLPTLSLPQSIVLYCFFNTNWFSGKCLCKVKALVMIKGLCLLQAFRFVPNKERDSVWKYGVHGDEGPGCSPHRNGWPLDMNSLPWLLQIQLHNREAKRMGFLVIWTSCRRGNKRELDKKKMEHENKTTEYTR